MLNHTYLKEGLMILKSHNIQIIPFEINLRIEELLVASIYNATSRKNKYFLWYLANLLELYSTRYENVISLGDCNIEAENKVIKDFLYEHTFYNMMKQNTCFKRWLRFVHTFTNSNFEIFLYEDKFLWNWFGWLSSYDIYYSQNKIWKVWTEEIKISQFQTIW